MQGVFFRAFVSRQARALGLVGYVRNLPDGDSVEVEAEGPRESLERLVTLLRAGPVGAKVENVETNWSDPTGVFESFEVRH